jgi:drug/metabolite transporter (DMT)-like permease
VLNVPVQWNAREKGESKWTRRLKSWPQKAPNGRMRKSSTSHLTTYLLMLAIVILAPLGNVLLGKGMRGIGSAVHWEPSQMPRILEQIFRSGFVWLGILSLLSFFLAYMLVLSRADYSFVQPATAVSYLVVALLGSTLLGERVNALRWLGIGVICLGVLIVGRTPPRTTKEPGHA